MGRSPHTNGQTASNPSLAVDASMRLQQVVTGWRGAERGQPLSVLHNECQNAVGLGGRQLLPAILLLVKNLDETNLQGAIRNLNGKGRGTVLRFRVKTSGRFDSALVPTGAVGGAPDCWVLAIEEDLPLRDQVALYGHALGHLLLIRDQEEMRQLPPLGPRHGHAHRDIPAALRMLQP